MLLIKLYQTKLVYARILLVNIVMWRLIQTETVLRKGCAVIVPLLLIQRVAVSIIPLVVWMLWRMIDALVGKAILICWQETILILPIVNIINALIVVIVAMLRIIRFRNLKMRFIPMLTSVWQNAAWDRNWVQVAKDMLPPLVLLLSAQILSSV